MAYTKTTWVDGSAGGTEIDADSLNNMEDGIEANDLLVVTAAADAAAAVATADAATVSADAATVSADAATITADAAVLKTLANAKGDLLVATAPNTVGILAQGTDGRLLESDTTTTEGIKWGRKFTTGFTAPLSPQNGDIWLDLNI